MDSRTRSSIIVALILVASASMLFGYLLGQFQARKDDPTAAKIAEIRNLIQKRYYGKLDEAALEHATLDGLCSALDRYCEYYTKEEYEELRTTLAGEFYGVGIQVEKDDDGYIKVISPIENSPAAEANVLSGDKVIEVNGTNIKSWPMDRIVKNIRGPKGTQVVLKILRGQADPFDVTLTRAPIKMNPVKYRMLDQQIGYIRMSEFSEQLVADFDKAANDLIAQGAKALVIDVRFNPGGLLGVCVDLCDRFLAGNKTIVTIESKTEAPVKHEASKNNGTTETIPIAVLINEGSASASEIFAGCVQDFKRGTLIGEKTFGKGLVQQPIQLFDGSYLKLTIARYLTPNGRELNTAENKSIAPDIEVKMTPEEYNKLVRAWSQEGIKNGKPPEGFVDKQLDKALEVLRAQLNGK
jgi:carboxyl-terminal processing protease